MSNYLLNFNYMAKFSELKLALIYLQPMLLNHILFPVHAIPFQIPCKYLTAMQFHQAPSFPLLSWQMVAHVIWPDKFPASSCVSQQITNTDARKRLLKEIMPFFGTSLPQFIQNLSKLRLTFSSYILLILECQVHD